MDEDLKLVNRLLKPSPVSMTIPSNIAARAAEAITRLRAEIEALKSDVSDLVRAGSDEATENERLVKERDSLIATVAEHITARSERCAERDVARAQRDTALEALRAIEVEATREGGNWVHLRRNIAVQAREARALEGGEG